jgi:hypothetical protein
MKVRAKIKLYPHQKEYVLSKHPRTAIIAGYASGKTYANVRKTLHLLELREGQAFIFYAAPTYDIIHATYYAELIEAFDLYNIAYHEDKQHHEINVLTPELKGTIKLVSMEKWQNLVAFNATDGILDEFDVISIDRQRRIWTRALARLRKCANATLSITTTPEGHKLCYELWKAGKIKKISASTEDNHSLEKTYIDSLYDCFDEVHIQLYVKGEFVNLNGLRAMYNYREEMLIAPIDTADIPHNLIVGMDFNVNPFCLTISFEDKDKNLITFDELYIRNAAGCEGYGSFTDKAMMLLLQKYPNLWYQSNVDSAVGKIHTITIAPDMTGIARKTQSNITDIAILRKYGCTIIGTVNPPVSSRLKIANMAFQKGLWKLCSNCKNLIQDIEMCVTDEHGELDKTDKTLTHVLDAATYPVFQKYKHLIFTQKHGRIG